MPNFKKNTSPAMKKSAYKMKYQENTSAFPFKESPAKTKLGRWLMGRKKHTLADGSTVITDKEGKVVKTKYKKGNRPMYHGL